ncbi:MAG: EAL domain-containing protein, partial [Acidimicrobiia bacterium]
ELTNELVTAIAEEQLVVHYQPEVALRGNEVWAEALVRWQHPTRGLLPPSEFIDLAEETGLIVPLGRQVLVTAVEQLARWRTMGSDAPSAVSVNLSARQLMEDDLIVLVADLLESLDLPPSSLWLELTETAILRDPDQAIAALQELKALGVGIAIDDFGTGYSSLTYARMFPVDAFKIDRSFIAGMTDDPVGTAASNNPVLTTLVTAVTEANLVDTLNSAPALTVFAPTDCAFAALDPATLEAALADPTGLLTTVLGFHVIPERLSSEELAGMTELTTFTGETLQLSAEGESLSLGGDQATVVVPDIQTANATVHLIDAVMLPPSAG